MLQQAYNPDCQDRDAGLLFSLRRNPSLVESQLRHGLGDCAGTIQATEDLCFMKRVFLPRPDPGQVFNEWTVLALPSDARRKALCQCSCGTIRLVTLYDLHSGASSRCKACAHKIVAVKLTTHGRPPEYDAWARMVAGERVAEIASEWIGRGGFQQFLACIGSQPTTKHTIGLIDNNKGYRPGNVQWVTRTERNRNTSHNHLVTFENQTFCLSAWAERLGMSHSTFSERVAEWGAEEAITRAVGERKPKTHCVNGHPLGESNVYQHPSTNRRSCRECRRLQPQRGPFIERATPPWLTTAHRTEINNIYLSRPPAYHIDHEVPLRGKTVCGLHVPWNLRAIPAIDNIRKGNRLERLAA